LDSLGHYKVLDRIGAGGIGEVYRARDTRLGRTVAIKVLSPAVAADPQRRERFLRDARMSSVLSHPNIVALYEVGEDNGQIFLVFEFAPGDTLKAAIGGQAWNPRRALDLTIQIADALADAHAAGIVHRDIKPENIIVTPKGNAKIVDFGLSAWTNGAAARERAAAVMATGVGEVEGPIAYLSPEQVIGEPVDHRTDIFSLGILLFEMLTGRVPFSGATPSALALQIVQATAPEPSSLNKALPRELDSIVAKALAKSLDHRYESAATMAAELRAVGAILDVRSEVIEAASPPPVVVTAPRSPGAPRSSRAGWLVGFLLLAIVAALLWFKWAS
jgi:serine/threonine protein kinase